MKQSRTVKVRGKKTMDGCFKELKLSSLKKKKKKKKFNLKLRQIRNQHVIPESEV